MLTASPSTLEAQSSQLTWRLGYRLGPAPDSGQCGAAPPSGGGVPRRGPAAAAAVCAAALPPAAGRCRGAEGTPSPQLSYVLRRASRGISCAFDVTLTSCLFPSSCNAGLMCSYPRADPHSEAEACGAADPGAGGEEAARSGGRGGRGGGRRGRIRAGGHWRRKGSRAPQEVQSPARRR